MAPFPFRTKHSISKRLARPSRGMGPAYLSSFALASGKSQVPTFLQLRLPLYQLPSLLADFYPCIGLQLTCHFLRKARPDHTHQVRPPLCAPHSLNPSDPQVCHSSHRVGYICVLAIAAPVPRQVA